MGRREDLPTSVYYHFESKRKKKSVDKIVRQINAEYENYGRTLSDNPSEEKIQKYFREKTNKLRGEIEAYMSVGYTEEDALKRVLPKAYALVKLASKIKLGKPHYDSQLIGGILLNDGYVSEMATGEGKTITAALPTYLNALLGKGAHVITPNAYLAKRDFEEMKPLYELLGLSVGYVDEVRPAERQAEIQQKTNEIFAEKLKEYSEEGKSAKKIQLEKSRMYVKAQKEARDRVLKGDVAHRQEQYRADITYGSSNAFAFDYLADGLETNTEYVRHRAGKPNFLVIDEADAVLFDDAVTPFVMSGIQSDKDLAISDEEKEKSLRFIELSALFMQKVQIEDELTRRTIREQKRKAGITKKSNDDGILLKISNPSDYEAIVQDDAKESQKYEYTQAIIYCPKTKETHITPLGEAMIYSVFKSEELQDILNRNKEKILRMQYDGSPLFKEHSDYEIKDGNLLLKPRALSYLIESSQIEELSKKFDDFMTHEYFEAWEDINNAVMASIVLERDVDYKYSTPSMTMDPEHEVTLSLIMNGRTAEGRVYSNGLQQALEAKERLIIEKEGLDLKIVPTPMTDTLASIPAAAFFARYDKFSGMTGTSATSAFRQLYGIETFKVPRNKPRNVDDLGERLYRTTEDKNRAILEEVIKSYRKGQPVLITTTSVEESIALQTFLLSEMRKSGFDVNIPVLNANVDKLEEEAKIIARAGEKSAITISTEMAGRGTDIKLGGKELSIEEEIELEIQKRVARVAEGILKQERVRTNNPSLQMNDRMKIAAYNRVTAEKNIPNIEAEAAKTYELKKGAKSSREAEVLRVGGLKVIGSGHFRFSRVDEQVKGRCGRQGNKGETIFFDDLDDLRKVGMTPSEILPFEKRLEKGPIIEEGTAERTPLADAIYFAQLKSEEKIQEQIFQSQKIEQVVSMCREKHREVTMWCRESFGKRLKEDPEDKRWLEDVEIMIDDTTRCMVVASSQNLKYNDDIKENGKLSRIGLDNNQLIALVREYYGLEIHKKDIEGCRTTGDLIDMITQRGMYKYKTLVASEGKDAVQKSTKKSINSSLNKAWFVFEGLQEKVKRQYELSKMAPGNNPPENIDSSIYDAYDYARETGIAGALREVLNPEYIKRKRISDGLTTFVVDSVGLTSRVSNKEGRRLQLEADEMLQSEIETAEELRTAERSRRLTSVNVPYFIQVLNEKLSVKKEASRKRKVGHGSKKSSDNTDTDDIRNGRKK